MPTIAARTTDWTAEDLAAHLGDIPLSRIRFDPPPGTAVKQDVIDIHDRENRLCELIDGTLVEKTVGWEEARVASEVAFRLMQFVREHGLGAALGDAGMMEILPGQVRVPDAQFLSWNRLPESGRFEDAVPDVAPDLAVEVLSESNTKAEMDRKLREYFAAGVRLVWYLDCDDRTVKVFTSPSRSKTLRETDTLEGGKVLPGFSVKVADLFATPKKPTKRK